jgi:Ser/Thr protein kinase RdoA (MazF antagonist)
MKRRGIAILFGHVRPIVLSTLGIKALTFVCHFYPFLKNILSASSQEIPFMEQTNLTATVRALAHDSLITAPYDQKTMIDAALRYACRTYQCHQALFTRQWLHNNANLNNFLIDQKTIYTLDLSPIRKDYFLCDLASLVISCHFFDIPLATIGKIVTNYFTQHKLEQKYFLVLNALVQVGLIKKYLKNIKREKSLEAANCPADNVRTYLFHLSKLKKTITKVSRKLLLQPEAKNNLS